MESDTQATRGVRVEVTWDVVGKTPEGWRQQTAEPRSRIAEVVEKKTESERGSVWTAVQVNPRQQRLKSRISPQRIGQRLNRKVNQAVIVLGYRAVQV